MLRTESRPNFPRRQPFGLGMAARVLSSCAALILAVGLMAPQSAHAQEDSAWHAALDVTSVSQNMSDNGVVLAYGTQLALGLRVSFAP